MIRIKKIAFSNFKNFSDANPFEYDFEINSAGNIGILGGANGYGKTTLFDALEICIRGTLQRSENFFGVEMETRSFSKMPFQNIAGKDVLLKLWIREGTKDHIFIRRYPGNSTGAVGGRANKTLSFFQLLESYHSNDPGFWEQLSYENQTNDLEVNSKIEQLLFTNERNKIDPNSGFLLLHYIQQQDNIHYLAKGERDKRDGLNFLFQIENEKNKLEALKVKRDKMIRPLIEDLNSEMLGLKKIDLSDFSGNKTEYRALFPTQKFEFDQETLFTGKSANEAALALAKFQKDLNDIEEFLLKFEPEALDEDRRQKELEKLDQDSLIALIAKDLISPDAQEEFTKIKANLERLEQYRTALEEILSNTDFVRDETRLRIILKSLNFSEDEIIGFEQQVAKVKTLDTAIKGYQSLISSFKSTRDQFKKNFDALHAKHPQGSECPFCGHGWSTFDDLLDSIASQADKYNSLMTSEAQEKSEIVEVLSTNYLKRALDLVVKGLDNQQDQALSRLWAQLKKFTVHFKHVEKHQLLLDASKIDCKGLSITKFDDWAKAQSNVELLKNQIKEAVAKSPIDPEKIANADYFKSLFGEDRQAFREFDRSSIESKRLYLQQAYKEFGHNKLALLSASKGKLDKLLKDLVEKVIEPLEKSIQKHVNDLVKNLQIPMYIYSAKILQNCPQGDGIFLEMHEKNNTVRFNVDNYSEKKSDHDIVHHLSSGQLAVVSIAFCLAINRLSGTKFKFLAIDDPLQTLDDLNIHSFIEVLRHDFRGYQLLFSTHEEDAAKYMSYRFWKAGFDVKYDDLKERYLKLA